MNYDHCLCLKEIVENPYFFERVKKLAVSKMAYQISTYKIHGITHYQILCRIPNGDYEYVIFRNRNRSRKKKVYVAEMKLGIWVKPSGGVEPILFKIEDVKWVYGLLKTDYIKLCKSIIARVKDFEAQKRSS